MTESLSKKQAQKLILLNHQVQPLKGITATLNAINKLGYVQIDTISVIIRAHHHTLWNRVKDYSPNHLEQLQKNRDIFEYWSHAAAYLPIGDYRFCLPKMQHMLNNEKPWHRQAKKIKKHVLSRIRDEGPLQSKDFEDEENQTNGWWDWKPAKQALELLFLQGKLMISHRNNFQKVFDLTERVLPSTIVTTPPTEEEYARYLIFKFLNANGIGNEAEFGYLRRGMSKAIKKAIQNLLENKELIQVSVEGRNYYTIASALTLLNQRLPVKKVKILSPFDNLIIQRKRLSILFDYDYQLECYVPKNKRKYGYFCLPILWGNQFVGQIDLKADRKNKLLIIQNQFIENKMMTHQAFTQSIEQVLTSFAKFNGCEQIQA